MDYRENSAVPPPCSAPEILPLFAANKQKDEETLSHANLVLQDMLNSKDISPEALDKADCVLILPDVKKFGFGVGGSGGRGPLLCRGGHNFKGKWSAPAMYSVGGASVGLHNDGRNQTDAPSPSREHT